MFDSVTAFQQGFDVQAWHFWEAACGLFLPHEAVALVGYEVGKPMASDDIAIEYSAATSVVRSVIPQDGHDGPATMKCICPADPTLPDAAAR